MPDSAKFFLRGRADEAEPLAVRIARSTVGVPPGPGGGYTPDVVCFTDGGSGVLDLRDESGTWTVRWLDVMNARWAENQSTGSGSLAELDTPGEGAWVAILTRE